MKKYNNTWNAKKLTINFNHKQWRQDLAFFILQKKFWNRATVTRAKTVIDNSNKKGSKVFEIFDGFGNCIKIQYKNQCEIEYSSDVDLIKQYINLKNY